MYREDCIEIERFGGVKEKPRPADINGPAFNPVGRAAGPITQRRLDRESLSPRPQSFALRLAVSPDAEYQRNQIDILKSLGIYEIFEKQIRRNLLIISSEVVSAQMAGPAIRVYNFAKILSESERRALCYCGL